MLKSILPLWIFVGINVGAIAPLNPLAALANSLESSQIVFNDPTPPNQGAPEGRQRGGASRKGPCDAYRPLAALIPAHQGNVFAKTSSPHPSFWFYLPEPLTAQASIQFTLLDAADPEANYTYKTTLTAATAKPGLLRLAVPPTAPPLTVGKLYLWTFSLSCNNKPADAVFVQGLTQRVALSPTLQNQLNASTVPLEQAKLYAANGIWLEAVDLLALQQRRANPPTATWNSLLQQANLQDLATKPFSPPSGGSNF
jgi:hypothetical protein